ncbi:hypothetical protein PCASD_13898 [Puccinia coronata f. sp. avenae]|uniref:polynucleotide adenylyltransferase n=1 Tax=Puccinia coronata f. sp. avenae TaxID=200324 RepID=A0A2N5S5R9_9BASI|nr:hypothetical protein PCASD_24212 [Puccinia coronata f. sp. avenae]PLW32789.1 hypothetical protein PCASD_13898 [Puccinia coronata f. sp. avenae]
MPVNTTTTNNTPKQETTTSDTHIPKQLAIHPQPSIHLAHQIFQYVLLSTPGSQLLHQRSRLVYQILQVIHRSKLGKRPHGCSPYTLQVFGSISFGLDSVDSDVDLSIMDPERPQGLQEEDCANHARRALPKVYNVKLLSHVLTHAQFKDVKAVPLARMPLVKFRSPNGHFSVDLTCNNLLGCRNSSLIRAYYQLSPFVFRPLALVVKKWAKARGYCDPSGSNGPISASSYTLILLLIAYLQAVNHLPNLQDPQYLLHAYGPSSSSSSSDHHPHLVYVQKSPQKKRHYRSKQDAPAETSSTSSTRLVAIDTSFVTAPPDAFGWRQHLPVSHTTDPKTLNLIVSQLLLGFFEFYDTFDFHASFISIRDGHPLPRESPPTPDLQPPPPPPPLPPLSSSTRPSPFEQAQKDDAEGHHRARDMTRLLASLQDDLVGRTQKDAEDRAGEESESEDEQITYIPFSCREGVPERVQRAIDAETLVRLTGVADQMRAAGRKAAAAGRGESHPLSSAPAPDHALLRAPPPPRSPRSPSDSSDSSSPFSSSSDPSSAASVSDGQYSRAPTQRVWDHAIVVVDPFLYERNTSANIKPDVLVEIRAELARARRVLAAGGSLDDLLGSKPAR